MFKQRRVQTKKLTIDGQFDLPLDAVADSVVGHANISAGVSAMQLNNLEVAVGRENESSLIRFELRREVKNGF